MTKSTKESDTELPKFFVQNAKSIMSGKGGFVGRVIDLFIVVTTEPPIKTEFYTIREKMNVAQKDNLLKGV